MKHLIKQKIYIFTLLILCFATPSLPMWQYIKQNSKQIFSRAATTAKYGIPLAIIPATIMGHEASRPKMDLDPKKYPELEKFFNAYKCDKTKLSVWSRYGFFDDQWIVYGIKTMLADKQFFFKYGIDRIINAKRMQAIIQQHHLDHITVAEKSLHKDRDHYLIVAAKKIPETDLSPMYTKKLSLIETQQLITLAEETGFIDWGLKSDWRVSNVFYHQQKIVFIDTDNHSFADALQDDPYKFKNTIDGSTFTENKNFPLNCKYHYALHASQLSCFMEPDAKQWLIQRLNTLKNSPEGVTKSIPLPSNTRHDNPSIDFEEVKKEYKQMGKIYCQSKLKANPSIFTTASAKVEMGIQKLVRIIKSTLSTAD